MDGAGISVLARWENFYVIVGSSAGALTGLQFVVITLVSQAQAIGTMREIRAFASPTVVHFCAALLISASISAPWTSILHLGLCLAVFGAAGLGYAHSVIWHARKQTGYAADRGDWFWYVALPLVVYAGLTAGGILLAFGLEWGLFWIAATTLLFLFIGIHNAWDTVTYVALEHRRRSGARKE